MTNATEVRILSVPLSDAEIQARGEELAAAEIAYQVLLDEKKAANDAFKDPIAEQKGLIARLAKEVADRAEQKEADIEHRPNFSTGQMEFVRADTGEVIDQRPLTAAERQGTLGIEVREGVH